MHMRKRWLWVCIYIDESMWKEMHTIIN
jgi:hypothetical protein